MKRILSLFLAVLLLVSANSVLCATAFAATTKTEIRKEDCSLLTVNGSAIAIEQNLHKTVTDATVVTEGSKTTTTYYADKYEIDETVYYACDASIAEFKLVKGGTVVFLTTADLSAGTTKVATAFIKAKDADDQKCGDVVTDCYTIGGRNYPAGGDALAVLNGRFIMYDASSVVATVQHDFDKAAALTKGYFTTDTRGVLNSVKCDICGKSFTVVDKVAKNYVGKVAAFGTQYVLLGEETAVEATAEVPVSGGGTSRIEIKAEGYSLMDMDNTPVTMTADNFDKIVTASKVVTEGSKTTTTYYADKYVIDDDTYYACDASIAEFKLVKGGTVVFLTTADLSAGTTKVATAFIKAKDADELTCGDVVTDCYTIGGKNYVAGGGTALAVLNGRFVMYDDSAVVDTVDHKFDKAADKTKGWFTTDTRGVLNSVKCDICGKSFTVVDKVAKNYVGKVIAFGDQYVLLDEETATEAPPSVGETSRTCIEKAGYSLLEVGGNAAISMTADTFDKTVTAAKVVTEGSGTTTTYYADRYEIDETTYYACDASIAEYKLVKGGTMVFLTTADLSAGTTRVATAFIEAKDADDQKCGDVKADCYTISGKNYSAWGSDLAVLNGKFVMYDASTEVATVAHSFTKAAAEAKGWYTTDATGVINSVKCDICRNEFEVTAQPSPTYDGELVYFGDLYVLLGKSTPAQPEPDGASGDCGLQVRWTLDDADTLTISGSGAMTNWAAAGNVPWADRGNTIKNVVIDGEITRIGQNAFACCTALEAFWADSGNSCCKAVDGVLFTSDGNTLLAYPAAKSGDVYTVPEGTAVISSHAFHDADQLAALFLPDTLEIIDCPRQCANLSTVYYAGSAEQWSTVEKCGDDASWSQINVICSTDDAETLPQFCVSSGSALRGNEIAVTLSLLNNPGLSGIAAGLQYDHEVFTLKDIQNGTLLSDLTTGANLIWDHSTDTAEDGILATVTFFVNADALAGEYPIVLTAYEGVNSSLENVTLLAGTGIVTVQDYICGDADGDTVVSMADITLLRQFMAEYDYETHTSTVAVCPGADADGDGIFSMKDVILLRQYLEQLDDTEGGSAVVLGPQSSEP